MSVTGDQLLDLADSCYNSRTGEYHGGDFNGYNFSVNATIRQDVKDSGKQGKKRKARKAEAVKIVNALFDHTRQQAAARLSSISSEASAASAKLAASQVVDSGELAAFASEVMDLIQGGDAATGSGIYSLIDPSFIITLITTIINAIQACKKPIPTPTPTPTPTPAPAPAK